MQFPARPLSLGALPLRPFALRLRDGFLLGMGVEPEHGSPCIQCSELWLAQRKVWSERISLDEVRIRRELIDELVKENSPHVFFEVSGDGTFSRMDCLVFPHPGCNCRKESYLAPMNPATRTNFAFSPIHQIKCARYGTPSGNLWLTSASGIAPDGNKLQVFAADREREASRFRALDDWMKKSALTSLISRVQSGESIEGENFKTGLQEQAFSRKSFHLTPDGMGAGASREEATLDAMLSLAKARTLRKFSNTVKNPMLIVGTNNWIRGKIPFFLLQQYDIHLLFYPNSTPSWVVGLAALSRVNTSEAPIFVFAADTDINRAIDQTLFGLLERCRPADWQNEDAEESSGGEVNPRNVKMGLWWTHWIYRCSKISLKDVLHLEKYTNTLDTWRGYFGDGQEKLLLSSVNPPGVPVSLRHIVKVQAPEAEAVSNVRGIATWSSFSSSLR